MASTICVCVSFVYPPIPVRDYDWAAWEDGQEERGSVYGRTREEAIENLLEEREEG